MFVQKSLIGLSSKKVRANYIFVYLIPGEHLEGLYRELFELEDICYLGYFSMIERCSRKIDADERCTSIKILENPLTIYYLSLIHI